MVFASGCAAREGALSSPAAAGRVGNVSRPEAPGPDQRFPRRYRLTSRRQYLRVYEQGRRVRSASFTIFGLANTAGHCRLGITVTRKVGGAVQRNRLKRVLREVFRTHRAEMDPALDLVVNVRREMIGRGYPEVEREFVVRFRQLAQRLDG